MHFATNADPKKLPEYFKQFIEMTGWREWKRQLESLNEQVRQNPLMARFIRERFGLELALGEILRYQKKTGRYLWPPKTPQQFRLHSFIGMVARVYPQLSPLGQNRLAGMVRDAFNQANGLGPLAFEMHTAAHLMARGFDVYFHDIEKGGGFDFEAIKNEVGMEIECKLISADIGRKIHRKRLYQISLVLYPILKKANSQPDTGRLVRILLPNRLDGNTEQHRGIADAMERALTAGHSVHEETLCKITVEKFSIADSPFSTSAPEEITDDQIENYMKDRFGIEDRNLLTVWNPSQGVISVLIESEKPDAVLKGIVRQLKDSSRDQLTGRRPGVLCVYFADFTEEELLSLARHEEAGTGLQAGATHILERRPNVHTLAFTAAGTVTVRRAQQGNLRRTTTQEIGPAYTFFNPNHPQFEDSRYKVF